MPSYKAIENVLNFLWGKGTKLEIHTNPKERTMMIRIPNEYIRRKVLEKRLWYVGTAMFHVAKWCPGQEVTTPDLLSIPIWAHLKGVPLDLRSQEGLSFAAGLVGDPKETDEYTKNLTNLEVAHVKVDADLSCPLPSLVELKRQSGAIIPVTVEYPWVPPSCSHCKQIGHIIKDCLFTTQTWKPTGKTTDETSKKEGPRPVSGEAETSRSSTPEQEEKISSPPPPQEETPQPATREKVVANDPSTPSSAPLASISSVPSDPVTASLAEPASDIQHNLLSATTVEEAPVSTTLSDARPLQKRQKPFKHKTSLKRPYPYSYLAMLPDLNPFTIPKTSPPNKTIKFTTEIDQNHPPISTKPSLPSSSQTSLPHSATLEGPLLLPGVSPPTSL